MDHGAMDSSSEHSSRASPATTSPKHHPGGSPPPGQPLALSSGVHQQQQQQQQGHPRDQLVGLHQQAGSLHQQQQQQQQQHHRGAPPTPGSPTRGSPPQGLPLSPPPLSGGGTPVGVVHRLAGLPPPGLGLLSQLGGMLGAHHGSPLELMAAHHGVMPPRNYSSPPPISSSDPTANECKLVEYRGHKVAAFIINNDTMLCLPQAFELFLKHLVGGLHTVYTKLKRLDIVPLVCNVEQVRILRGLGAIQPGVNRCKLLSCKDFDTLYRDCTTASSRPGRPPKRASVSLSLAASHLAAQAGHHAQQLKKHRLDNGDYYENGHLEKDLNQLAYRFGLEVPRLEKSPLLANGYNHPPTHLSHMQFMQLGGHPGAGHTAILSPANLPHHLQAQAQARAAEQGLKVNHNITNMEALARSGAVWDNCRAAYEDIVKQLERLRDERGENERALALDHKQRDHSSHNGSSNGHSPVLNLSKTAGSGSVGEHSGSEAGASHRSQDDEEEEENLSEDLDDDNDKDEEMSDVPENLPLAAPGPDSPQALNYSQIASAAAAVSQAGGQEPGSVSSTETLLRNIQGLLKVAADNARQQEKQINYEKAELQMDVLRERQVKDNLERQLQDEQKIRVVCQKRFKKEKRARKQMQDQLDLEIKRRTKLEDALKATGATPDQIRQITESVSLEGSRTSVEPAEDSPALSSGGRDPVPSSQSSSASSSTHQPQQTQQSSQQQQQQQQQQSQQAQQQQQQKQSVASSQQYRDATQSQASRQSSSSSSAAAVAAVAAQQSQQQQQQQQQQQPPTPEKPGWGYSGLDLIGSPAAAFWQNYQESLAEFEMERKSRQHPAADRDQVKSPLQESRAGYYKNSVLFTSAT